MVKTKPTHTTLATGAIRLPSGAGYLHIIDGTAWFAQDIKDIVLKPGDTIALEKHKIAVLSSLSREESVTFEITQN